MADRPDRTVRDKTQVIPDATNPELFKAIERWFSGDDQRPQKIEVRQAYGPGARKYGTVVDYKEWKENSAKPGREELVGLSNRFLDAAQSNCNALGKSHKYGILAKHHTKQSDYYAAFVVALRPTQDAEYDPNDPDLVGDIDDVTPDVKRRDSLLEYSIAHIKAADENERWRQDQHSQSTGDLLSKYSEFLSIMVAQNMELMKEHRELFRTADEALSHKADRDRMLKDQEFKHSMFLEGFNFLKQIAPVALSQIKGKQAALGEPSPESLGVKTFLEGLSEPQAKALFGTLDENGRLKGDGIFSVEQIELFAGIAEAKIPATEMSRLLEGGNLAINTTQMSAAQAELSPRQIMPLMALIMAKQNV